MHEVTASSTRISWHEPKDNGSPILGYWIERKEVNSKHWTRVNRALLNSLEVKVIGLMEGLTYIFRVCAENLAGPGPFSEPSDRTVAMDAICEYLPVLTRLSVPPTWLQTHRPEGSICFNT